MAITQEVNIEMLEKLPDGNYKKKNPQTKASQVIANNGQTVEQHLADDNVIKHKAKQIGFNEVGMTATTVNEAILEAFMLGNNTKKDLVDKLLLLDPSLSISYASTWQVILTAISGISTGKKWASGSVNSANTRRTFEFSNGGQQIVSSSLAFVDVTGLTFKPSVIIVTNTSTSDYTYSTVYSSGGLARLWGENLVANYSSLSFTTNLSLSVTNSSFVLPVNAINQEHSWVAFE